MANVKTANFGRGVGESVFRANIRRVFLRGRRAITGCQEVDEADPVREHRVMKAMLHTLYRFVGFRTHVPIAIPRGPWKVLDSAVIPASQGVPRQSPARQVVWARLKHRLRRKLPPLNVFNIHFPRKAKVLEDERQACMKQLKHEVAEAWSRGESSLITTDANGMPMLEVHSRARRVGGKGIDWIIAVEHPKGVQFEVLDEYDVDMTIDGHNAHGVKLKMTRPKNRRKRAA